MKAYYKAKTEDSPYIILDTELNIFEISGTVLNNSFASCASFITKWLQEYQHQTSSEVIVTFRIEKYSWRNFWRLLKLLTQIKRIKRTKAVWCHYETNKPVPLVMRIPGKFLFEIKHVTKDSAEGKINALIATQDEANILLASKLIENQNIDTQTYIYGFLTKGWLRLSIKECFEKGYFLHLLSTNGYRLSLKAAKESITFVSAQIGQLTDLKILDLSDNPITALPVTIGNLDRLKVLNLSDTLITSLPKEIEHLKQLQKLDLYNTPLTHLPKEMTHLELLQELDLRQTNIVDMANELPPIPQLRYLVLDKHHIKHLDKIKAKLPPWTEVFFFAKKGYLPDIFTKTSTALYADATEDSPKVVFDKPNGIFEISGYSFVDDSDEFYQPLIEWMKDYAKSPNTRTVFKLKMDILEEEEPYFQRLYKILKVLEGIQGFVLHYYLKEDFDDPIAKIVYLAPEIEYIYY